jgi:hypothetical protein
VGWEAEKRERTVLTFNGRRMVGGTWRRENNGEDSVRRKI